MNGGKSYHTIQLAIIVACISSSFVMLVSAITLSLSVHRVPRIMTPVQTAGPDLRTAYKDDYMLQTGAGEWKMVFEDGPLLGFEQTFISQDLNRIYSKFTKSRILPYSETQLFTINKETVPSYGYMDFSENEWYKLPGGLLEYFGAVVSLNGKDALVISTEEQDEYREAIALNIKYEDEFLELDSFLHDVNSLTEKTDMSEPEVLKLFYFWSNQEYDYENTSDIIKDNIQDFYRYRMRKPSMLSCSEVYGNIAKQELEAEFWRNLFDVHNVSLFCETAYEEKNGDFISDIPIIYRENVGWQIFLAAIGG